MILVGLRAPHNIKVRMPRTFITIIQTRDNTDGMARTGHLLKKGQHILNTEEEISIELIAKLREKVKQRQNAKRYEHTLGVAYTAACIAFTVDTPPLKAELAGLLHDCAKCYTDKELISMCRQGKVELTKEELASPAVIHAKYGSYMAEHEFGICDRDILNAIRYHTTGRPDMSTLEKIIFTADYIEPLRDKASNLNEARKLAFTDLDECVYNILDASVKYLSGQGMAIVPDSLQAYKWYSEKHNYNSTPKG